MDNARDLSLEVPGVAPNTYQTAFKKLRSDGLPARWGMAIWMAMSTALGVADRLGTRGIGIKLKLRVPRAVVPAGGESTCARDWR